MAYRILAGATLFLLLPANPLNAAGIESLYSRGLCLPAKQSLQAPPVKGIVPLLPPFFRPYGVDPSELRADRHTFTGTVGWVYDGDSMIVYRDSDDKGRKVRLLGVDTPEKDQPFGPEAKSFVMDIALKQRVTVEVYETDTYGRALGAVYLPDGRDLRHALLDEGLAWWYRYFSDDETLGALEKEACVSKRGLWTDPEPEAPWDYRYRTRRDLPYRPSLRPCAYE